MALSAASTAIALVVQGAAGAYSAPTNADLYPCANARLELAGVTVANPEYTGSVQQNGDFVAGKTVSLTFSMMLRPPGGAAPPAAGAYIPGRVLRGAKFTENVVSAAIPAVAEAIGAGPTTTSVTLGASAAATADLYKGMSLFLSDNNGGAYPKALTMIRGYSAGKVASLAETLGAAPSANYQIPKQLAYTRDISAADPNPLSIKVWLGGKRYDMIDMTVSSLQFVVPTSTRASAENPMFTVTLSGDIYADADEAVPAIPALGPIPFFKDGDEWLAYKAIGGSTFTLDMNIGVGYPPNPNKPSGNDAPQLTSVKPGLSITKQLALKAQFDSMAIADAQTYQPFWAQWGYTAGNMVSMFAEGRFNYASPDIGQDFNMETIDLLIDVASRNVSIVFPY